jgi:hypothetical protein
MNNDRNHFFAILAVVLLVGKKPDELLHTSEHKSLRADIDKILLNQAGTNAMAVVLHTITKLNGGQTPDFVWSMEHLCEMLEIMMSYTVCKVRLANEEEFVGVITRILTQEDEGGKPRWPATAQLNAALVLREVTPKMKHESKAKQRALDALEAFDSLSHANRDNINGKQQRSCLAESQWIPSCFLLCTSSR